MQKSSKIYIAGHTGLVGSAILRRLHAEGYINLITRTHTELDLRRQAEVEAFFESEKPEYVFLAAAKVGGIWANMNYPAEFIYDNLAIATNVISSSHKYGTKKLMNLGSSCIYPKHAPQPIKEEYLLTDSLEPTNEPYSIAKIAAIKLCRYFNEQYGTNFLSVMPNNLYGPNDNFDLETSHVLPALIRKFHLAKLATKGDWQGIKRDERTYGPIPADFRETLGLPTTNESTNNLITNNSSNDLTNQQITNNEAKPTVLLWGTGQPYREFLHVDDLAAASIYLMENFDSEDIGEFVNVGSGEDHTIKEYAEMIKEIVGFEGEVIWDKSKPDGMPRKLLDTTKIQSLGWIPQISLNDGIRQIYRWYLEKSNQ